MKDMIPLGKSTDNLQIKASFKYHKMYSLYGRVKDKLKEYQ